MNHSDVVKDLLHKLSKNEFLAQDGGNKRYFNKVNGYRNQLNGLYGGVGEFDQVVTEIENDIDQLIPLRLLEQYEAEVGQKVDALLAYKVRLEKKPFGEKNFFIT